MLHGRSGHFFIVVWMVTLRNGRNRTWQLIQGPPGYSWKSLNSCNVPAFKMEFITVRFFIFGSFGSLCFPKTLFDSKTSSSALRQSESICWGWWWPRAYRIRCLICKTPSFQWSGRGELIHSPVRHIYIHLPNLKANVELPACTVYPWNIGKSLWISVSSWSGRIVYHDTTGYSATCCYQENASCVQCIDLAEDIAKRPQLPHAEVANCHCSKDYLCALCGSHCCCLEKAWGGYTI